MSFFGELGLKALGRFAEREAGGQLGGRLGGRVVSHLLMSGAVLGADASVEGVARTVLSDEGRAIVHAPGLLNAFVNLGSNLPGTLGDVLLALNFIG
ncbi:MAG: hypothetical protein AB7P76_00770 [Candidatus Melainabacteria bacterium]